YIEPNVLDGRRLQDRDARLAPRVIEQELVEVGARHLEAVGWPRVPVAKVEHVLEPGFLVVEERAAFGDETACSKLVEHAQPLDQRQVRWKQRLPDMKARERLALDQPDREMGTREQRRRPGSAPAAADH